MAGFIVDAINTLTVACILNLILLAGAGIERVAHA